MSANEHKSKDEIAALAMGPAEDREAFEAHAAACEACGPEWQRATRLAELMGALAPPPPPSAKSLARTQARVRALIAAEPRVAIEPPYVRSGGITVAALVLVSVVIAFVTNGPAISVERMVIALATIGVAALLPSLALRSPRHAIGATLGALSLSLALGWLDYNEWPLIEGHTVGCMEIELAIGALPLLAMVAFARGTGARMGSLASAAAGACGALAGQGVLLTSCAADESVLHVLVFHVAGVVIATAAGAALGSMSGRLGASR